MPDIPPDAALDLAKAVAEAYSEATTRLLELVAKRLARGIDEPGWAEAKLAEIGRLRDEARAIVNDLAEVGPAAVAAAVEEASGLGTTEALKDVGATLRPLTNRNAVRLLVQETISGVDGAHRGILRHVEDAYRQVIAEAGAPGVVTGTETRRQATQRALDGFADRGITGFRDSAGRQWELESYAEMATRTAAGRAMIEGRLDVYEAAGRDVVIVSDAPEECPRCRPFEGKLLSISGDSVGELIDGRRVVDSVRGAQSKGLHHPNCRHDLRPYIPGLTRPMTHTADPDGDEFRGEQRRLERERRRWLRRESVATTPQARSRAAQHIDRIDDRLVKITSDRAGFAAEKADALRHRNPAAADRWDGIAKRTSPGTEGKRLRYRERPVTGPGSGRRPPRPPRPVRPTGGPQPSPAPQPPSSTATAPEPTRPTKRAAAAVQQTVARGRVARGVGAALDAIEARHRVPDTMPRIPVKVVSSRSKGGSFLFENRVGGQAVRVEVSSAIPSAAHGEHQSFSFAHEFGHFMDHSAIGEPGFSSVRWSGAPPKFDRLGMQIQPRQMPADVPVEWRAFWEAVDASQMAAELTLSMPADALRYYLDPREIWARAYAQWVATGDDTVGAAMRRWRDADPGVQWSDEAFGPIASAIEAILRAEGLMP